MTKRDRASIEAKNNWKLRLLPGAIQVITLAQGSLAVVHPDYQEAGLAKRVVAGRGKLTTYWLSLPAPETCLLRA